MELVCGRLLIRMCMTTPVHAGSSINIALRQPAYQISNYGKHYASRAVDGNRNSDMRRNSCACTHKSPHPWWYVDLGAIYRITRVTIVNRNGWAHRLNGINVGVTNVKPTNPVRASSYDLCATFPGPGRASQVIVLNCEQVCIHSTTDPSGGKIP